MTALRIHRSRDKSITVRAEIHAKIVSGTVTQEELTRWINDALSRHHTFRAGFIGPNMCGIEKPFVVPETPF